MKLVKFLLFSGSNEFGSKNHSASIRKQFFLISIYFKGRVNPHL